MKKFGTENQTDILSDKIQNKYNCSPNEVLLTSPVLSKRKSEYASSEPLCRKKVKSLKHDFLESNCISKTKQPDRNNGMSKLKNLKLNISEEDTNKSVILEKDQLSPILESKTRLSHNIQPKVESNFNGESSSTEGCTLAIKLKRPEGMVSERFLYTPLKLNECSQNKLSPVLSSKCQIVKYTSGKDKSQELETEGLLSPILESKVNKNQFSLNCERRLQCNLRKSVQNCDLPIRNLYPHENINLCTASFDYKVQSTTSYGLNKISLASHTTQDKHVYGNNKFYRKYKIQTFENEAKDELPHGRVEVNKKMSFSRCLKITAESCFFNKKRLLYPNCVTNCQNNLANTTNKINSSNTPSGQTHSTNNFNLALLVQNDFHDNFNSSLHKVRTHKIVQSHIQNQKLCLNNMPDSKPNSSFESDNEELIVSPVLGSSFQPKMVPNKNQILGPMFCSESQVSTDSELFIKSSQECESNVIPSTNKKNLTNERLSLEKEINIFTPSPPSFKTDFDIKSFPVVLPEILCDFSSNNNLKITSNKNNDFEEKCIKSKPGLLRIPLAKQKNQPLTFYSSAKKESQQLMSNIHDCEKYCTKVKKSSVKRNLNFYYEDTEENNEIQSNCKDKDLLKPVLNNSPIMDEEMDKGVSELPRFFPKKPAPYKFSDGTSMKKYKEKEKKLLKYSLKSDNRSYTVSTNKHFSFWDVQAQSFAKEEDLRIEEFEEENLSEKLENSLLDNESHYQNSSGQTKQFLVSSSTLCKSNLKNSQFHLQTDLCTVDESEVSVIFNFEATIQEELSQESSTSARFDIENSISPNTKLMEGSQSSDRLSFPPALKDKGVTPSNDILDSASKNKKKQRRSTLVERLQRLVRSERADVNMFHHEGAPKSVTSACSLTVDSVVLVCSRLTLKCHFADARPPCSEAFSIGEEVVDPEVHLFINPSYAKNITPGSTVLIYPPWRSVWLDNRDLIIIHGVTKVQILKVGSLSSLPRPLQQTESTEHGFYCHVQEDECSCKKELMSHLFSGVSSLPYNNWAEDSVMAALARGRYPNDIRLKLEVVHRFAIRKSKRDEIDCFFCVDENGHFCQLNFFYPNQKDKLDALLKGCLPKLLLLHKLTINKRLIIDRCRGLRSILSALHKGSVGQQIMYVLTPSSDHWSAHLLASLANFSLQLNPEEVVMLDNSELQADEKRVHAHVQVIAERGNELYVWNTKQDSYHRIEIASSAVLPNFSARSCLRILYLLVDQDILVIDMYTMVTIVETEAFNSPTSVIPPLSLDSLEGNLVVLDSIITKVNSDVYLRWIGDCGHSLLKLQETELFYCSTCTQTVSTCDQKLELEMCVVASSVSAPIRVKVKNETAHVLLCGSSRLISANKSYNMIGAIGSTLKCLALVLEVLKNPLGDVLEFLLEEL